MSDYNFDDIIKKIFDNKEVFATELISKVEVVEDTTYSSFPNVNNAFKDASIHALHNPVDLSRLSSVTSASDILFDDTSLSQSFYEMSVDETLDEYLTRTTNEIYNSYVDAGVSTQETNALLSAIDDFFGGFSSTLDSLGTTLSGSAMFSQLSPLISAMSSMIGSIVTYNDGVTETTFGGKQEASWAVFKSMVEGTGTTYKINVNKNTPLNSEYNSLYGSMIMGTPFQYTSMTDPNKRVMIDTFVKDGKFISLTPGLPKFNGLYGFSSNIDSYLTSSDVMMEYLLKNGVDASNYSKDKRYYIFEASYGKYYSYLETLLNTIWLKMGLGTETDSEFNIMSFFDGLTTQDDADPLAQYCSAMGFIVNPVGTVTESLSNEKTGTGAEIGSAANNASSDYQAINFRTGMGTGGSALDAKRVMQTSGRAVVGAKDLFSNVFQNTVSGMKSGSGLIGTLIKGAAGFAVDTLQLQAQDYTSTIQQFSVANGMKVVYPELWSDSNYSKSMTFDFNFTSPYGDPLSIFKYVMVPWACLMVYAMPRQADYNGYVSPFFLRADLPGFMTCDFGMMSSLSYTRGGPNGLFTKDGLPRSISGSFSIDDLSPYMAMSRRLSFMQANPSYTSFIDSLIGLNSVHAENNDDNLEELWGNMLNRVNGTYSGGLWNKYDSDGRAANSSFIKNAATNTFKGKGSSINWMRKV